MELHPYIFSLVLYRGPELGFDVAVGIIIGNDQLEEWNYYPLTEGLAMVEEYLEREIDILQFWTNHVIYQVNSQEKLVDKYIELINSDNEYLLHEPFVTYGNSIHNITNRIEDHLKEGSFIIKHGDRLDDLLKN